MGTFAETAIIDYRLTLVDQGKQTSFSCFHLQQTSGSLMFPFSVGANKWKLPFSVSGLLKHGDMET
jgi:hypothetical protein